MWRVAIAGASAFLLLTSGVRGGEPSLREVLARAAAYVTAYHRAVASVIAEERYVQRLIASDGEGAPSSSARALEERTLVSDVAIISGGAGEPAWMAFRDVREVDGVAVRRDDDRMRRILAEDTRGIDRAVAISRESTRYNLASDLFTRTINVPTLALDFLLPEAQHRFSFKRIRSREQGVPGSWEIGFQEKQRPTVIRTPDGGNVPVHGRFLLDPDTGRVLESTLDTEAELGHIVVSYAIEPRLQIAVPVRMQERYGLSRTRSVLVADATYSNYRRFETAVRLIVPKGLTPEILPRHQP